MSRTLRTVPFQLLLAFAGFFAPARAADDAQTRTLILTAGSGNGGFLHALDLETGERATLAQWPVADLAGVTSGPDDRVLYVLDRGRGTAPARLLCVDPGTRSQRTVTSGGFLREPRQCCLAPNGEILVADPDALSGSGALIRIEPQSGRQRLVSFGGAFEDPTDIEILPSGNVLVLDHFPLEVDPLTGRQRRLSTATAPFADPMAFERTPEGNVLVLDGGTLHYIDPSANAMIALLDLPRSTRDIAMAADGTLYLAWSQAGEGGLLQTFPNGAATPLFRGRELGDIRGLALAARIDMAGGIPPGEPPPRFTAPPRPTPPEVTIELRPQTVTLLNGPGPADDVVIPGGAYPLATALRAATPGSDPVIGVYGEIPGALVTIGGGDADTKAYVAHWGEVPMRFVVIGKTSDARIREFGIWQKMNDGTVNGGVIDAWFENLTIEARYSQCVSSPKGHQFGLLRFYNCRFVPDRESLAQGGYDGFGYKWGIRAQGRGRWDVRSSTFAPVQEHAIYVDSPQGDCYFMDIQHQGSTRTAIQVVNRSLDNPGSSGFGTLLFENVRVYDLWGDGGSGITVAGHLGDLVFRGIRAREAPETGASHGAIVVWADAGPQHGLYLHRAGDGRLYSAGTVTIESCDIDLPHADRPLIAVSGAEKVRIDGFTVEGNRAAFSLDSTDGIVRDFTGLAVVDGVTEPLLHARVANGSVGFGVPCPVSAFPGFRSPSKVQLGKQQLSDAEIDQLWCSP